MILICSIMNKCFGNWQCMWKYNAFQFKIVQFWLVSVSAESFGQFSVSVSVSGPKPKRWFRSYTRTYIQWLWLKQKYGAMRQNVSHLYSVETTFFLKLWYFSFFSFSYLKKSKPTCYPDLTWQYIHVNTRWGSSTVCWEWFEKKNWG